MEFRISVLRPETVGPLVRMAPKAYQGLLRGKQANADVISIGGYAAGEPVGFCLGRVGEHGEIISLFVMPTHWRRGIGTAMLSKMEDEFSARGCRRAFARYSTEVPTYIALE